MDFQKDKLFQQLIRSNLLPLCESTECTSQFLDLLVQIHILSHHEKDIILSKPTKYEKSSEFYNKITMKGPVGYKGLVNALRRTDQNFAADILYTNGGILTHDIINAESTKSKQKEYQEDPDDLSLMFATRSKIVADSKDLTTQGMEEDASNGFNQLSLSSPFILTPVPKIQNISPQQNINPVGNSDIFTFSNALGSNPADEIDPILTNFLKPYSLTSSTKGHALIINIMSFDFKEDWFRKGASYDTEQLVKLFQGFGYQVFANPDLSVHEFKRVIEEFKEEFNKGSAVDSSIVVVMSHGDEGDNIYTRDRGIINVKMDIVERFTNANCPQLIGKPKLFFFQYCRGDTTDYGTTVTDSPMAFSRSRTESDSISHTTIPSWTDILVCYSTLEGHYAYRETGHGSWFIQILCEIFTKYGHQLDVCELLNLVAENMKYRVTEVGEKQICPYTNIGFTKKFYFNKQ